MSILRGLPEKCRECDGGDFGGPSRSGSVKFLNLDSMDEDGVRVSILEPETKTFAGFGDLSIMKMRYELSRTYEVVLGRLSADNSYYIINAVCNVGEVSKAWLNRLIRATVALRFVVDGQEMWRLLREGDAEQFGLMVLRVENGEIVAYSMEGIRLMGGLPPMPEKKEGNND